VVDVLSRRSLDAGEQGAAPIVFDIGLHRGEDTAYYLARGYRVVGVDADVRMVERAAEKFASFVAEGRLRLLNAAVSERAGSAIAFHLSDNTLWSSADPDVAGRFGMRGAMVEVETVTLEDLIAEFGLPLYCKMDIEGLDAAAVRSLEQADELPQYISVETECLGEGQTIDDEEALATLRCLSRVGYRRFKLVDQRSLVVLEPGQAFYTVHDTAFNSLLGKLGKRDWHLRRRTIRRVGYAFPAGATGPFGSDLESSWLDYDEACETLLFHRRDYFATRSPIPFGFWCDWHAVR
jgi:FkbM family methyltransferase